ncbi:hypothetical protein DW651_17600 [Subdoligranulum sp. AM23-21AC]|uniref:zinc-finger-containing protein n=1 Tax=Ruthenibacterium lactatiformans TaxID=1550024 RepID=UPI000E3F0293|nr:zinc-finger-containing protein [Ruthenibacterium lactatiformans]RGC97920.1 hypothetical protein DW194_13685 [Subdoligranulum sp. AM16-9]RGD17518.1 hypothetical protein DW651_17600 [Subdoligranulum sp. AM23-21AC]
MKKIPTVCDYCGGKVIRCPASELYGKRGVGDIYMCTNCNAAVGIDKDGCPKGRLANAALRSKRIEAHLVFDHFWQSHHMTRSAGYAWMAAVMKMPTYAAHIANFNMEECVRLIELCYQHKNLEVSNNECTQQKGTLEQHPPASRKSRAKCD